MGQPLDLDELEAALKALANINRLRLVVELAEPRGYHELELNPSREDAFGSPDRRISRQAVRGHMQTLLDAGVVDRVEPPQRGEPGRFQVNTARLFEMACQMRELAQATVLEPEVGPIAGPHLVVVAGVPEGHVLPMAGRQMAIGSAPQVELQLPYDLAIRPRHAALERGRAGFSLRDLTGEAGSTRINAEPVGASEVRPLCGGDLVGMGRTLLRFEE